MLSKKSLSLVGALALGASGIAHAGGVVVMPNAFDGFYVGGTIGGMDVATNTATDFNVDAAGAPRTGTAYGNPSQMDFASGFNLGYGMHWGERGYVGFEGNMLFNTGNTRHDTVYTSRDFVINEGGKLNYNGNLVVVPGILINPTTLLFAKGGVSIGSAKYSTGIREGDCTRVASHSESKTLVGGTLGAGIKTMLTDNIAGFFEYNYYFYGRENLNDISGAFGNETYDITNRSARTNASSFQFGLSYQFNEFSDFLYY